ncbi:MAG: long-chain fatty acid--CoA ligase [Gammaproteobacteria bacterium]|nr:MAG: long-chain fatty acid--CoA ligase [Gammaproteobacteria bacterium]
MYSHQLLIKDLLLTPVVNNPEQEIIYSDLYRFTYREFHQRVKKLANMLTDLGIKQGDTVAVMDYDSHRYLELYFAVPMIGAVLHTVNVKLTAEQILYTIEHAEDSIIFVHQDFIPILEHIRGRISTVSQCILLQDEKKAVHSTIPFSGEYESILATAEDEFVFETFDENTRATTFYTTGTTGMPKGVYFSHRQLVLHTLGAIAALATSTSQNFRRDDVYMPLTPMFHVHAWGLPYVATFMGVKQVYPGKYIPNNLLELIDREKVTFSHCVPTILHMLLRSEKIDAIDLSHWKVIIGGATLPKGMCRQALEKGIDVFTGYGMSETCPILTLVQLNKEELAADLDTQAALRAKTGKPLGLVDIRIVDEAMHDVASDGEAVGELVVRSPWLTAGYFKDKKNTANLWKNGYLHTGDVANRSPDGHYKITDRSKDIVKVAGEWVSSLELEDIINQHPAVSEVAVVAMPHDKWTEIPLALVVINKEPSRQLKKAILEHTKEYIRKGIMARESMLIKIKFVEVIDKTSVGKIDKKALRKKHC